VRAKSASVSIYVMTPDADARGLAAEKILGEVTGVDYAGFVNLVTEHDRTQNWL